MIIFFFVSFLYFYKPEEVLSLYKEVCWDYSTYNKGKSCSSRIYQGVSRNRLQRTKGVTMLNSNINVTQAQMRYIILLQFPMFLRQLIINTPLLRSEKRNPVNIFKCIRGITQKFPGILKKIDEKGTRKIRDCI